MASSLARFRDRTKPTPEALSCQFKAPEFSVDKASFPVFSREIYMSAFPQKINDVRADDKLEVDPSDFLTTTIALGSGRMGQAYLARRRDFNKHACTKVIPKDDSKLVVWLQMDARVVDYVDAVRVLEPFVGGVLNPSPFICKVLLSFRSRFPSQIMKYNLLCEYWKPQRSMCECLQKVGKMTELDARFYLMELADAIIFIHGFGKIFRRLCTCYLLVKENGHLLLAPYTLCRQNLDCGQPCNMLTMNCGDQFYASPEVVFGVDVQSVTDWWSFGVIFYQMVTSKLPFNGRTLGDLGKAITESTQEMPDHLSPECAAFIKHLLHKDPRRRIGFGKNGYSEIRKHPFFNGIDWRDIKSMVVKMEPPFKVKNDNNMVKVQMKQNVCVRLK